ncbi:hypothetical protein B0T11DRAFT_291357 [Plectosphaerella cucumerina]|uniref:Uncharacterized protein n=1 Tax=Plectosphaerella cucumerina TaxID=40658 RepID=A0A8K0WXU9_9PEZI|nr:hypothetical protein B0T11DRAFT_291357 [Plectosphaerella cucumerina]
MKFQIFTTTALFAAMAIATPLNFASAEDNNLAARAPADKEEFPKDLELALELALTEITAIPDEVLLKGDEATNDWLVEHGLRDNDPEDNDDDAPITARGEEVTSLSLFERDELDARGVVQVAKCIAAISKVIVSTAVPAAKILRIKRYLQLLGGVRKTVLLLVRAKTGAQRLKLGGRALFNLANELFGIQSIKNNCSKL